ncbi:MAG: aminoglycoside phosphotransferase family protein [Methylococcaceae bacterium]|nr:aminoglycoside phosphotransferase family protein [Methylococcaceae bacterium]
MNTEFHIATQFRPSIIETIPLGNGLINDTFLVTTESKPFVLQRINRQVFPRPELIMENLNTLIDHINKKNSTAIKLQIPDILKTQDGNKFFNDNNGDCWRALSFIDNTESLETLTSKHDAEQTGFALGHFHRLVSDLNPAKLHDTLPGFHVTPNYLDNYRRGRDQSTSVDNSVQSQFCADFIASFQHLATHLETAKNDGLLPIRVIHGDPKLNNFLFDKQSRKIVSLIDLDTVKPGLVHYDIGDCLRSCCHNTNDDSFNIDFCEVLLRSYLTEANTFFSTSDYHFLYAAIELIPFELGLRFYTDYLDGNRYFKVSDPLQNLQRACSQFRLCASIMDQKPAIEHLISLLKK